MGFIMGWTFKQKPHNVKRDFDSMFTNSDTVIVKLLNSKLYLTHYVALLEISCPTNSYAPYVVNEFILIKYCSDGEIGYKDIGEESALHFVPKDHLSRLTPISERLDMSERRAIAVDQHRQKSVAYYNKPRVSKGDRLEFSHELSFGSFSCKTFTVVDARKGWFRPAHSFNGIVRITQYRQREFTQIQNAQLCPPT